MIERITKAVFRLDLKSHTLPPFKSTNSYLIISQAEATIIDPGFYKDEDYKVIRAILKEENAGLKSVLLTHSHRDHIEGIGFLLEPNPGLTIYIHKREMHKLDSSLKIKSLKNNDCHKIGQAELKAVFTPGHSPGHLSYYLEKEKIAFVGDLMAKNSSTWVGVPEGNVNDYFRSLAKIENLDLKILAAGHGKLITKPYEKIEAARKHRLDRLEQILRALKTSPKSFEQLRTVVYPGLSERLLPYANRSLEALINKLIDDSTIVFANRFYSLKP